MWKTHDILVCKDVSGKRGEKHALIVDRIVET
jgi:hypothetical protein